MTEPAATTPQETATPRDAVVHGARPVAFRYRPDSVYAPVDQLATVTARPRRYVADRPITLPEAPQQVRELAAAPLAAHVRVGVLGIEGGAGRTTLTRQLVLAAERLRGGASAVAVDGVPVWGTLTAQVDLQGRFTIPDVDELADPGSPDGMQPTWPQDVPTWWHPLSFSKGALTAPGPRASEHRRSTPEQVWAAASLMTRYTQLAVVDTVADVTAALPATLAAHAGVVVLVTSSRPESIHAAAQVLEYLRLAVPVPDIYTRTVVAVRGVQRKWTPEMLSALALLEVPTYGGAVQTVRIPYVRDLDERKPPRDHTEAVNRLLAAVVARAHTTAPLAMAPDAAPSDVAPAAPPQDAPQPPPAVAAHQVPPYPEQPQRSSWPLPPAQPPATQQPEQPVAAVQVRTPPPRPDWRPPHRPPHRPPPAQPPISQQSVHVPGPV